MSPLVPVPVASVLERMMAKEPAEAVDAAPADVTPAAGEPALPTGG